MNRQLGVRLNGEHKRIYRKSYNGQVLEVQQKNRERK